MEGRIRQSLTATAGKSLGLACGNCQVSGSSQTPGFFTPATARFQEPVFNASTHTKKQRKQSYRERRKPGGQPWSCDLDFRTLIGRWEQPAPAGPGGGDRCHGATALVGFLRKQPIGIARFPARSELALGVGGGGGGAGSLDRGSARCEPAGQVSAARSDIRADGPESWPCPGPLPAARPRGRRGRLAGSSVARPGSARPAEPSSVTASILRGEQKRTHVHRLANRGPGVGPGLPRTLVEEPAQHPFCSCSCAPVPTVNPAQTSGTPHFPPEDQNSVLFLRPSTVACRATVFWVYCVPRAWDPLCYNCSSTIRPGRGVVKDTDCTTFLGFESRLSHVLAQ